MTRVGWIGLGKMGLPMSAHIRKAGHSLHTVARSAASREKAEEAGAIVTAGLAALAAESDVVFATIPDDAALGAIVFGEEGLADVLRPGQIFVEMSTVSPKISTKVAAALEARGTAYLRAPVSGSTAAAAASSLTVVVSGPEQALEKVRPLIQTFAARQFHVGASEEARYLKLVLNTLVGATSALLAEALTLGRKGGLGTAETLDVLAESAVASPLIRYKRDMLVGGDYAAQFSVAQMMKDLDLILECGREEHVPLHLVSVVRQNFEAAFARGHGEEDFFVLYRDHLQLTGV